MLFGARSFFWPNSFFNSIGLLWCELFSFSVIFIGEDTACAEECFDGRSLLLVELAIDVEECIAAAAAAIPAAECINEF